MSTEAAVQTGSHLGSRTNHSLTRPLLWSIRREIWENRSIYMAPLIVAAVQVFGFLVSTNGLAERRRAVLSLAPAVQRARITEPYDVVAMLMILTIFIVGVFYCLDALYGERRDRSILFWKSLPVSDLTAVLAKASIPFLILPAIAFLAIVCTQLVMLAATSVVLVVHHLSPASTFEYFSLPFNMVVLLYGLTAIALWHAPIYGWLLLVSGWVRRAAFLWAVLPFFAVGVFEKVTFNTSYLAQMVEDRLIGFAPGAFAFDPHGKETIHSLTQLTPGKYLSTPGLWMGLVFAVAFIAIAVRLRRYRGPL
jgi:ABC-2 type transport system permease protein